MESGNLELSRFCCFLAMGPWTHHLTFFFFFNFWFSVWWVFCVRLTSNVPSWFSIAVIPYFRTGFTNDGTSGKEPAYLGRLDVRDGGFIPGLGGSPEAGMATHSSVLGWGIPWTEESGSLQSTGSHKSRTQLTWLSTHRFLKDRKKEFFKHRIHKLLPSIELRIKMFRLKCIMNNWRYELSVSLMKCHDVWWGWSYLVQKYDTNIIPNMCFELFAKSTSCHSFIFSNLT